MDAEAVQETLYAFADAHRDDGRRAGLGLGSRLRGGFPCRAGARLLTDPLLFLDLVEEVGDADAPGSPGLDAGLDRGADVVGVDMAVPHAVTTDDDDRVAE